MNAAKAVLREQLTAKYLYKRFQINNLNFCLNKLGKEQTRKQTEGRKYTRVEINEKENGKALEKIKSKFVSLNRSKKLTNL